jgi:RsiW-degrading membrane proteinase PrsW (M82 family)
MPFPSIDIVTLAIICGVTPPLFWLWFWLQEDRLHPEPRSALAVTFFAGMCMVIVVIPLEKWVQATGIGETAMYVIWAYIEEAGKFLAAYCTVLTRKFVDEPIDPIIYMVTVALGFSALENALFLVNPALGGTLSQTAQTGAFRFIGANVLHTLCSAVIGIGLMYGLYKNSLFGLPHIVTGVVLAGLLHSLFNIFILRSQGAEVFVVLACVWGGALLLLLVLEHIKHLTRQLP